MRAQIWIARRALLLVALLIAQSVWPDPAAAVALREQFSATLSGKEQRAFDAYVTAQVFHEAAQDAYWSHVGKLRERRKAKKKRNETLTTADYVQEQPPVYSGPSLPQALAKRWADFQAAQEKKTPTTPRDEIPNLADFVASARKHYAFVPEQVSERTFKERYAREALALGLNGDQVVRVYALETGGLGTADMQAGIHPISRKGAPISTALGYAQLLAANSINELSRHGMGFVARLKQMAQRAEPGSQRQRQFQHKARALERMVRKAKSVPYIWSRHVAFANTDVGRGIHAVNLDADIGPWLQVIKLKGLKETAEKAGRGRLSGAEIELMNLAGPGTGLEMMEPAGRSAPTTNFFARAAYYRNTIVRGKTSQELLLALDERMEANLKNAGSIEFRDVFARLNGEARAGR